MTFHIRVMRGWLFVVCCCLEICQGLQRPLVIGHRGTAYLPELTLDTLSMAYAYESDVIEIDVCLSRDNQLIVIHGNHLYFRHPYLEVLCELDIYLDAVTDVRERFANRSRANGLHYVIDFTLDELRQLNVSERIIPANGTQVYPLRFPSQSNIPFHLPTLNDTIELILGLNYATGQQRDLLIEIKRPEYHAEYNKSISSIVLETLNAYNLTRPTDPIIIQTFHIEELMHIRRNLSSQLRLNALMTLNSVNESSSDYDYYRSEEGIRNLSTIVQALAPDHLLVVNYDANGNILNATHLTKWAHQYNLRVYPFTFRKDRFLGSSFEQLIEYFWRTVQVDGFITDHPDIVLKLLTASATSSPILSPLFFVLFPPMIMRLLNLAI